ncbi:hypothetical protein NLJ89_g8288 [Agrocybe chaxingu]|uniref:U6 small nuclear RNA (adenine-(43)-N(6))-methyltransferase n=1 Tax=Agrocybe chaxingu TaxID=84603 RepID=A0A9W8MSW5_9AGAR|nr:hypothetical protein NLJ89_g8288 [Agrocybe chaxingu]
MHPRNPYRNPPDFVTLAISYPLLFPYLNEKTKTIDFKDGSAQRRLTEAIMFRDFGVKLEIPEDRLCPPVPNRMNYVLWIQDIVYAHRDVLETRPRRIRGIDVGTGATAIYPILACKMEGTWDMVGTEIDDMSFTYAQRNVASNDLRNRIDIRNASKEGRILFPLEKPNEKYDFCMCNPPFYASAAEVEDLAREKELPPNAVCTGSDIEMIYPDGGEAGFVGRMVEESETFQTRCKWYTSMFGKMSSVTRIVEMLRQRSIPNYAITEFVQGQTRRWAVAWSYTDAHLPDSAARIPNLPPNHVLAPFMPPRNTLSQPLSLTKEPRPRFERVCTIVSEVLGLIDGVTALERPESEKGEKGVFFVEAKANKWSRSARRKKTRLKDVVDEGNSTLGSKASETSEGASNLSSGSAAPALTCSLRVRPAEAEVVEGHYLLEFQWMFGRDRGLFESFASHVGRKVGVQLEANTRPLGGVA